VLASSVKRIYGMLSDDDVVLDVGGWASPLARADWVLDLMPYETRGLYGERPDPSRERFSGESWVQRDICAREPWPFADNQFDFIVCSQTLEDVRDPVWVCSEMNRVAKAGYVEVPSRLEEQMFGVHGSWVGWSHHRWLIEIAPGNIEFVFKPHLLEARKAFHFPEELAAVLTTEERVQTMFWEGGFGFEERIFMVPEELHRYLADFVTRHRDVLAERISRPPLLGRARHRLRRLVVR
jgi:hypothetical protein